MENLKSKLSLFSLSFSLSLSLSLTFFFLILNRRKTELNPFLSFSPSKKKTPY